MPPRSRSNPAPAEFQKSVFVNCPFDDGYKPLFQAAVFAVTDCGFIPRSALEVTDSAEVRIDKIGNLIDHCRFGLHDISRTEADPVTGLPRFNMPLELGIFLGSKRFGTGRHKTKNCLILDLSPYRYQQFISDISGQDIAAHDGDVKTLITKVRNWLAAVVRVTSLPGGAVIAHRFTAFQNDLPAICATLRLQPAEMTFVDYGNVVRAWLASQALKT